MGKHLIRLQGGDGTASSIDVSSFVPLSTLLSSNTGLLTDTAESTVNDVYFGTSFTNQNARVGHISFTNGVCISYGITKAITGGDTDNYISFEHNYSAIPSVVTTMYYPNGSPALDKAYRNGQIVEAVQLHSTSYSNSLKYRAFNLSCAGYSGDTTYHQYFWMAIGS